MEELLYTSADVHKAIVNLFKDSKKRKVAIAAFVGYDAEAYLPRPKGLELICWPKEGGTNPDALRKLAKRGAKIMFSDSLHMKVYWSEDQGAVVTSANLSNNALGSGNLKEIGVKLSTGELDIDRIISSIDARPLNELELKDLDRRHKTYVSHNRGKYPRRGCTRSYHEWFEFPYRPDWKLGWCDSTGTPAQEAKRIAREEYNVNSVDNFIAAKEHDYKEADFVLVFRINNPSNVEWLYVSNFVRISKSDTRAYSSAFPYQAVQILGSRNYPVPPFRANKKFSKAFSKAVNSFGISKIQKMKSWEPPKQLLDLIEANF